MSDKKCDYCGEKLPCLNRCDVDMNPGRDVKYPPRLYPSAGLEYLSLKEHEARVAELAAKVRELEKELADKAIVARRAHEILDAKADALRAQVERARQKGFLDE